MLKGGGIDCLMLKPPVKPTFKNAKTMIIMLLLFLYCYVA
jgi:hypothetical protein